jgi:hypothetical protein
MGLGNILLRLQAKLSAADVVVLVEDGDITVVRGKVKASFLSDLKDIVTSHGLTRGIIFAHLSERSPTLSFSKDIPKRVHQQIRNVWGVHHRA